MKEVIVFAAVLFAVFQMLKTEPQVKEVIYTIEKPVVIEKEVVREPVIEKTIEKVVVVRENPQPIYYQESYQKPKAYYATYEVPIREERRNRAYKENPTENLDTLCDARKPNFFGVETQCQEWRKRNGYDY